MMISFSKLWIHHPAVTQEFFPCRKKDGDPAFDHQCAVSMGIALTKSGLVLTSFGGVRCWHGHSPAHVLRAEELARWLAGPHGAAMVGKVEETKRTAKSVPAASKYAGRTGIVFFLNFWGAGSQGDHIDLWNGNRMTHGASAAAQD